MHTLSPWPFHMLLHIYDARVSRQSFYMSQIGDYLFRQTFCFVHFELDRLTSSNNDHTIIVMTNE